MSILSDGAQLVTAAALAYNIWQTWRVKTNVIELKEHTNSKMDALLVVTAKAAEREGTAAGIVEGHAAGLEQGRNEERPHQAEIAIKSPVSGT